ncbi:hypothetical protein V8C42DRAFT_309151 [Trichoderma barbatum]
MRMILRDFKERNRERQKELLDFFSSTAWAAHDKEMFPCWAAQRTAILACQTGYFEHFVSLLKGNVLGWEADEVQNEDSDDTTTDFGEETQMFTEYDIHIANEDFKADLKSMEENDNREERVGDVQEINSSDDEISRHGHTRRRLESSARRPSASHGSFSVHGAGGGSVVEKTTASANGSHSRKRQKIESPATPPTPDTASVQQTTVGSSKKRSRAGDDDHRRKRQRTQSPVPTLTPNAPSSVRQTAVESSKTNSKRRSRSDDDDDDDRGHKRQRTQSPAPALPPITSSTQQAAFGSSKKRVRERTEDPAPNLTSSLSSSIQQAADGNVTRKRPRANGRRKSQKQDPSLSTPDATSEDAKPQPLRRSTRRTNKSTLQELDRSGKPRSIR